MVIQITNPISTFDTHFSILSNKRILFSGKFGSGKTYFLKEFFNERQDSINTFWLSPVKYSVGLNEDIFEFIKFDLSLQLIGMPEFAPILNKKFSDKAFIKQFLSSQPQIAIDTLASLMESIATDIPDGNLEKNILLTLTASKKIAETLINSLKKYREFKKDIENALKTTSQIFVKYLEDSTLKKGSIFEDDLVTQTIRAALEICKMQSKKDNVLIIDDFDRLDPEHVFRILNILSVHNEMYDGANKFGFDKIIIVCDYENISRLYAHKYGSEINFSGYITKFFSTEVYHFSNTAAIQHFCSNELSEIVSDKDTQDLLGLLLAYFVQNDILTIRDIVKIKIPLTFKPFTFGPYELWKSPREFKGYSRKTFRSDNFVSNGTTDFHITSDDYPFIQAIRILCVIFGDYSTLVRQLNNISNKNNTVYSKKYINSIMKSIFTLLHHSSCFMENEFEKLFFSFTGDSHEFEVVIDHPVGRIFGLNIPIKTGWTSENKYNNEVSLYKNVNSNIKNIDYSKNEISELGNYKILISYIVKIINFLDSSGSLQQLGVTKSTY